MPLNRIIENGRKFSAEFKFEKCGWKLRRDNCKIVAVDPNGKQHYICQMDQDHAKLSEKMNRGFNILVKKNLIKKRVK